ncbi:hypothetical protein FRC07_001395 [Ceratobasidium sp. 392]|nr:hypothetical protein FRC07_001395 [Ceratobasidium sp. 392]
MARIESLPFDVVHTVLAYLGVSDLPAVALVCHLFCAAAIPRLYATVRYTPYLAKQYGTIVSPLDLLVARAELLACLRSLGAPEFPFIFVFLPLGTACADIRALPLLKGAPHPQFTRACRHVLANAPCLSSFAWSSASASAALLPAFLSLVAAAQPGVGPTGIGPVDRTPLVRLAITDDCLSPSDAQLIPRLGPVENIALHKPSPGAIRALADWIAPSSDSDQSNARVCSLTLSHAHALHPDLLLRILYRSPRLRSLTITDCVHITHSVLFSLLVETQLALESLSFTVTADWADAILPPIPTLRHVSVTVKPPDEPEPDRYTDAPTDPLTQRILRKMLVAFPQATLHVRNLKRHRLQRAPPLTIHVSIVDHHQALRPPYAHRQTRQAAHHTARPHSAPPQPLQAQALG